MTTEKATMRRMVLVLSGVTNFHWKDGPHKSSFLTLSAP